MATKADQYRANARHEIGEDYHWGDEGTGGVAGDDDYDCSGFTWAMLNNVGVHLPRTTADGYKHMGVKIAAPSKVGADFAVLLNDDGHAHHIIPFIGRGETVEAKGKAWGVVAGTVAGANARGAKWYRFPNVDLGRLTEAMPKPTIQPYPGHLVNEGDHGFSVRWVQKRLNAHGFRVAVDGDFGPKTKAAVHSFQGKHNLEHDGIVGPITWKALAKS